MTDGEKQTRDLIEELFRQISRGNITPFLDRCADNIELYVGAPSEVPFGGRRRGKAEAAKYLRDVVHEVVETHEMEPHELIVAGDNIVALGHALCRVRANGVWYRNEWAIIMTLHEGMFTRISEYFNSAVIVYALRGESQGDLTVVM